MGILTEIKSKILTIKLNRPDRGNSLDPPTIIELYNAIKEAQSNEKVKLVLLTGAGEKDFCTGMDVDAAKKLSNTGKKNLADIGFDIAALIYQGKPTIVSVNGRAMGMGVVFSLAADYRLCVETVQFRMPEILAGIYPAAGCVPLMTRIFGPSLTKKILIMAEPFNAMQALQYHIVDEIVPVADLPTRMIKVAKELSQRNPSLVRAIKFAANSGNNVSFPDALEIEKEVFEYFTWSDTEKAIFDLQTKYHQTLPVLGNPEQLRKEFEESLKD